jgi:acid phosphatase family membrane protein YuiD
MCVLTFFLYVENISTSFEVLRTESASIWNALWRGRGGLSNLKQWLFQTLKQCLSISHATTFTWYRDSTAFSSVFLISLLLDFVELRHSGQHAALFQRCGAFNSRSST